MAPTFMPLKDNTKAIAVYVGGGIAALVTLYLIYRAIGWYFAWMENTPASEEPRSDIEIYYTGPIAHYLSRPLPTAQYRAFRDPKRIRRFGAYNLPTSPILPPQPKMNILLPSSHHPTSLRPGFATGPSAVPLKPSDLFLQPPPCTFVVADCALIAPIPRRAGTNILAQVEASLNAIDKPLRQTSPRKPISGVATSRRSKANKENIPLFCSH